MAKRRGHGEGSVHQRSDGRWVAQIDLGWHDGKRQRKYLYGSTQSEVVQKRKDFEQARAKGVAQKDARITLGQYLDQWLDEVIDPSGLAPGTKYDYRHAVDRYIRPRLGKHRLAALSPQQVQRWVNDLAGTVSERTGRPLSRRTVQHAHAILRRALNQAERWDLVLRNVAQRVDVPRPRPDSERVHDLSDEDLQALLEAAESTPLYAFYVLAALTGMRKGELLGLSWSCVDLEARQLRVEQQVVSNKGQRLAIQRFPKTKSSRRTLSLPETAIDALKAHRAAQAKRRLAAGDAWQDHDLVFPTSIGTAMDPRNLTAKFHALCKQAGVAKERFHNLRHTTATIAFAQGLDIKQVSVMLGHSGTGITRDLYMHTVPALQEEGADRIAEVVMGKPRHLRTDDGQRPADKREEN